MTRPTGGPERGIPAPDFFGPTIAGDTFSLKDAKGQIVVLDFWATWCPPCRKSLPALQALHKRYENDERVLIASVNIDQTPDYAKRVARYVRSNQFTFPVILDPRKRISARYRVKTVPTMVVINAKGEVSSVQIGLSSSNVTRLTDHIEDAINAAR